MIEDILLVCLAAAATAAAASTLWFQLKWKQQAKHFEAEYEGALLQIEQARTETREEVTEELKDHGKLLYAAKLKDLQAALDADSTALIAQALIGQTFRDLQVRMKSHLHARYGRMSQELIGSVTDEAESLVRDLNIGLCENIWDAFQSFKVVAKDSPPILPEGAKLIYTKGIRTVVVIEQKPQTRTVAFSGDLIKASKVRSASKSRTEDGCYRFTLAFPYVYFVIVFDNGKYSFHELYFRNKPLTSVREHLHLAPLPNVWRNDGSKNRSVCMGSDFHAGVREELTIARQCDMVVGDFWQRTFSDDLGTGGVERIDPKIKNYAVWQANTEANSLFILEVAWPKGKTFKGVIEPIFENRERRGALDPVDEKIRTLLTEGVAALTRKLQAQIEAAKTEANAPFDEDGNARRLLEEIVLEHSRKVFQHAARKTGEEQSHGRLADHRTRHQTTNNLGTASANPPTRTTNRRESR